MGKIMKLWIICSILLLLCICREDLCHRFGAKLLLQSHFQDLPLLITHLFIISFMKYSHVSTTIHVSTHLAGLLNKNDSWPCRRMTNRGVITQRCPPLPVQCSQWGHVALLVTSPAPPLTKEGNKHPSRETGRPRETEREVGGEERRG